MNNIKITSIKYLFAIAMVLSLASCDIDDFSDPNNPSVDLVNNPSVSEIQNLVSGAESGMRNRLGTYYDAVGVVGREYYRFSGSDPRFTTDLLGGGSSTLDNNTFYTTGPFAERYRVVKNTNFLLEALSNASSVLTDSEISGAIGYAKTLQAYQLLLVLNQQYQNGIRTEVADPDNLGAFRNFNDALTDIQTLLNEGASALASGSFSFSLSTGFTGFDTADNFLEFNKAIAARVALYQGDLSGALSLLDDSFFNINGDFDLGPGYFFSTAGGDQTNPMFFPQNSTGETRVAHPSFLADAEAGDARLDKISLRDSPATLDDLSSDYDVWVYRSQTDPIPIIRNEELILIYAEANIGTDVNEVLAGINAVRNAAGLGDYAGATDDASLIDEILNQRRYSLFAEGHRWVDMRRHDKLSELPIDRVEDDVWSEFPIPATEN